MKGSVLTPRLPTIPVVDVREGGTLRHASESSERARGLRDACVAWFPAAARPLVPLFDGIARRWLTRSQSPYVEEVRAIAATLGFPGIWFLNGSYQWSCTALARDEDGAPWLARTLDWPFPGLGRGVTVARQAGPAGEFWNVTWPGAVGVLSALAPGRFAATINLAPLYRRTRGFLLRPIDYAINAVGSWLHVRHAPPAHVLRQVFETARDYRSARAMLAEMPVARPVLFALIGTEADEACVIERTMADARIVEGKVLVANDWQCPEPGWEPRSCGGPVATDSRDRCATMAAGLTAFGEPFGWLKPPVLNWATRVALEMSAADGMLRVAGHEPVGGKAPARQATYPFKLAREHSAV